MHACSSGGTQAGILAGCALHGVRTRVIGISADDPVAAVSGTVRATIAGLRLLMTPGEAAEKRGLRQEVEG
jgi:1-aminocyclopropane-1-carboxylate deaminase/D-cysteine desulfhydrase-like pyridoxal-dependent ACC family enzyme